MTTLTKLIGIAFICYLFFGAIVVDVFNWSNLIYGIPVIVLEIAFCISFIRDEILDVEYC
jgi:hypothetical protein